MQRKCRNRCERGQSLIELIFILPIYVLLMILVVQLTATYYGVFDDLSDIRNEALKAGQNADVLRPACFERRNRHSFLMGLTGSSDQYETRVRLYAYGDGPPNCPS
jgi:hypothetical protein